jgi:uncharacterized protein (TIGR03086 family)
MELLDAHRHAMAHFDRAVAAIGDHQWPGRTPCREWSVRDLVNHLVYEQLWVPPLLSGATISDIGDRFDGDVLGDDPVGAWRTSSAAALAAWEKPGALDQITHLSFGDVTADVYGWQITNDLAVHGWDLATAVGAGLVIDDELATTLVNLNEPFVDRWQGMGIFAPPVAVPADASPQARLVALFGRDPDWA